MVVQQVVRWIHTGETWSASAQVVKLVSAVQWQHCYSAQELGFLSETKGRRILLIFCAVPFVSSDLWKIVEYLRVAAFGCVLLRSWEPLIPAHYPHWSNR